MLLRSLRLVQKPNVEVIFNMKQHFIQAYKISYSLPSPLLSTQISNHLITTKKEKNARKRKIKMYIRIDS